MRQEPLQVLRAAQSAPVAARRPSLAIAGATGVLGNEMLRRLVGAGRHARTLVLAREPITVGLRGVEVWQVPSDDPRGWPDVPVDIGVILFEPPRMFHERERALWTPGPDNWTEVARWLRRGGAHTLAVVLPHAAGRLPDAVKRGLATLDEQAVASLGFARVLFVRSAQKPDEGRPVRFSGRMAKFMLSVFRFMIPSTEQPVRAAKVAELAGAALEIAPPGIHVASPEIVWEAAQGSVREVAARWLLGAAT